MYTYTKKNKLNYTEETDMELKMLVQCQGTSS